MMTFTCPASTEHLEALGKFLHHTCQSHHALAAIELAITEVVVNAMSHGQASQCSVHVQHDTHHTQIIIEDDGVPFDPFAAAQQSQQDQIIGQLREGGYGLAITIRLAKTYAYQRRDGNNLVMLTFPAQQSLEVSA